MSHSEIYRWVTTHKHMQSMGTATCAVSNLILCADEMRSQGHLEAAEMLSSAARSVLSAERWARIARSRVPLDLHPRPRRERRHAVAAAIFKHANRRRTD